MWLTTTLSIFFHFFIFFLCPCPPKCLIECLNHGLSPQALDRVAVSPQHRPAQNPTLGTERLCNRLRDWPMPRAKMAPAGSVTSGAGTVSCLLLNDTLVWEISRAYFSPLMRLYSSHPKIISQMTRRGRRRGGIKRTSLEFRGTCCKLLSSAQDN